MITSLQQYLTDFLEYYKDNSNIKESHEIFIICEPPY